MKKKSRPKKPPGDQTTADAVSASQYLESKDVFAAFVHAASSIGNEVQARRDLHADVLVYLGEKKLVEDFNAWLEMRRAQRKS